MSGVEKLTQEFEEIVMELQKSQREMRKLMDGREIYVQQESENLLVKNELDLVEKDGKVFKLNGPMLEKVELSEAKTNVNKRLELINKEMENIEKALRASDSRQQELKQKAMKIQEALQKIKAGQPAA